MTLPLLLLHRNRPPGECAARPLCAPETRVSARAQADPNLRACTDDDDDDKSASAQSTARE